MSKPGWRRRRRILLLGALLLALLAGFAPQLAGTSPIRRFVARRVGAALGREVELGGLDAGWTSGVTLRNLSVANRGAAFSEKGLLDVDSVRLDGSLASLLFGEGPRRIVVEGLTLRVEEQAGGRTNLDDLFARLAAPPPPPPERPPPRKKPVAIELVDCTVRVRVLPKRPQPEPFDPFRSDPVIRPAGEGAFVAGLERFHLLLESDGAGTRLRFNGGVFLDGRLADLDGELQIGGDDVSGRVAARGIDLSRVSRLVPPTLRGTMDVEVEGSAAAGASLEVSARNLHVSGAGLTTMEEKWITLDASVRRGAGDRVVVESLSLQTASGRAALEASGTVPPAPGTRFRFQGNASTRLLLLPGEGTARFDFSGRGRADGIDLTGRFAVDGFVFDDPDLEGVGPARAELAFDLGIGAARVEIRRLAARGTRVDVAVSGRVGLTGPPTGDLAGKVDLDLDLLYETLRPLLGGPEQTEIRGRARIPGFQARLDRTGGLAVKADAQIDGLSIQGVFDETIAVDHLEMQVDAEFDPDADLLKVAKLRVDDLHASGRVAGLREGRIRRAEGAIKGSVRVRPLLFRLLEVDGITSSSGLLRVDAQARTEADGFRVEGRASLSDVRMASPLGRTRLDEIAVSGRFRQLADRFEADLDLRGDDFAGALAVQERKGRLRLDLEDVSRILSRLPAVTLPAGLDLRGAVAVRANLARSEQHWQLDGTLESPALTVLSHGRGLDGDPLVLSFLAREIEGGWSVAVPEAVLPREDIELRVAQGFLGDDGSFAGTVHLKGELEQLAAFAPELAELAPAGRLQLACRIARAGELTVDARLAVQDFALTVAGRRGQRPELAVEVEGAADGAGFRLDAGRVRAGRTRIDLKGSLGEDLRLAGSARGFLEEWAAWLPFVSAAEEFEANDLEFVLARDGAARARGRLFVPELEVSGAHLVRPRVRFDVAARRAEKGIRVERAELLLTAVRGEFDTVRVDELVVREKGRDDGEGYTVHTDVESERLQVGEVVWDKLAVAADARLETLLESALQEGVSGHLRFGRWRVGPVLWEDGDADFEIEDGVVSFTDLVGTVEKGRAVAQVRLRPGPDGLAWEVTAKATGMQLRAEMGNPLSILVPILRVGREGEESALTGRIDIDLHLEADDTTDAAIMRTMRGKGFARFDDIAVRGSILLPLLGLRIDRILMNKPYRFDDLEVRFDVSEATVRPVPFKLRGKPFHISMKGWVRLDGEADLIVAPTLLPIPLRVSGNLDDPRIRPAPFSRFK